MRRLRRPLATIACLLAALSVAGTAPATAEGPWSVPVDLHATRLSDRAVVVQDGTITDLELPEGARLDRLVPLRLGWVLTATTAHPGEATSEILVWAAEPDGITHPLPSPAVEGSLATDPVPLVDRRGSLDGLAWLEGSDPQGLAVRFARWDGAAWVQGAGVSGPAPGSQLALDAATLADGRYLLVWSRYDGQDDEIYWATIEDGEAGAPKRLQPDNDVPDITPALIVTSRGPLVAWSRYDGQDYRLHLARLEGNDWRIVDTLPGQGAFLPRWQRAEDGTLFLTYREGGRQAWTTVRMDAAGSVDAIARVTGPADTVPRIEIVEGREILTFGSSSPVRLDWQPVPRLPK